MKVSLFILIMIFASCSLVSRKFQSQGRVKKWEFVDQGVHYPISIKSGVKDNKVYRIKTIYSSDKDKKVIEKLKVISKKGLLNKNLQVLRPDYSYLEVWIEKEKYITKLELNKKDEAFDVTVQNEVGVRRFSHPFLKKMGVYCFYSQIVECLRITGFFDKVKKYNAGEAKLNVIWEGAFIYGDLYQYYPKDLFTSATFVFNGEDEKERMKFSLNFDNQTIYYLLDQNLNFHSRYWIAQNISTIPVAAAKSQKKK